MFNALVKARAFAADQLFATLDTTTRSLWLGHDVGSVSLSDTVGFIRDLPHKLVEAFEATLHEAAEADLLLHVMDVSSAQQIEQRDEVLRVLAEIGAADVPQIWVCNKCDLLEESRQPREPADWVQADGGRRFRRVFVSAQTGEGLDVLRQAIADAALERLNPGASPPSGDAPLADSEPSASAAAFSLHRSPDHA